jgi:DNA-binding transcriptional LysR family regulator
MPNAFASNAKIIPPGFTESLGLFLDVAASGSFSAVGRRLGLAPSSVARQIARLEAQVGAKLLQRSTRALTLTEAGELLRDRGTRALGELNEAREAVAAMEDEPRGLLRITAPISFANRHLLPMVSSFLESYPQVRVELQVDDAYVDLVRQRFDLALRTGALADSQLISTHLARQARVLCAAPAYVRRRGVPQSLDDLLTHDCLSTPGEAPADWWVFGRRGAPRRLPVGGRFTCNSSEALLQAALHGLGIAHLASWLVGDAIRAGDLQVLHVPGAESPEHASIQLVRTAVAAPPKVRAFVEHLRHTIGEPPYWDRGLPLD